MSHHVVFLERDSIKARVRRPGFEHTYAEYAHTPPDQIVPRLRNATVAIINKVQLGDETLSQLPRLRMVAITATGYDASILRLAASAASQWRTFAIMRFTLYRSTCLQWCLHYAGIY